MLMECSAPPPLSDEQISMIADGWMDKSIQQHLDDCPSCRGRLNEIMRWDAALIQRVRHFDCPSPERLGEYAMGWIDEASVNIVHAHVEDCDRCQDELAMLRRFLDMSFQESNSQSLADRIIPLYPAKNIMRATRIVGSNVLKGSSDETTFDVTAGSARVYVEVRHSVDTLILTGQVIDREVQWADALAEVRQDGIPQQVSMLDEMGEFRFDLPRSSLAAEIELYITSTSVITIIVEHISTRKP